MQNDCLNLDINYYLGENSNHYKEIENYEQHLADYRMPDLPDLWGLGRFHSTAASTEDFVKAGLDQCFKSNDLENVDTIIICTPNTIEQESFEPIVLDFLKDLINSGLSAVFSVSNVNCTNFAIAIELACSLLQSGRKDVLIIGAEIGFVGQSRLTNYAIFSDFVGSLRVNRNSASQFKIHSRSNASVLEEIYANSIEAFDKANEVNLNSHMQQVALNINEINKVYPMNLFLPLLSVKYKKLGFKDEQVHNATVQTRGHCWGFDPFISLKSESDTLPTGLFLLNSQAAGRSSNVLITKE